jgi:ABC-type dipeptide/oligopeptide/nickel transport system ATPase component
MDMDSQKKASEAAGKPMGPDPDDSLIWYTDQKSYDPIIGLDDFQLLIQNIVDTFKQKEVNPGSTGYIWSVQGEPGSGKSYCIDALLSMLNNTDHMKIKLPGENIAKMDCLKLARFICSEAGTELKGLESFKKYNTTLAAWLRDEVIQKVFRTLEEKRGKRMVWICITNLNIHDITGKNTQDFLLFLYECVLQNPWLNIVLDGLKTELPSKLLIATKVYNTHSKTREEIRQYLHRFLRQGPFEKPAPDMIDKFANRLFGSYDAQVKANSKETMKFLYYQSTALLFQFIEQVQKK